MEFINTIKPIIDLLSALTSPIVAITVVYIAYQQWKINASKASKDIQKEKLEIYMAVKRFLRHVDSFRKVDQKLYNELQEAIALADFLFDADVTEWLFNVEGEASCWLDTNQILEKAGDKSSEGWEQQERKHLEASVDKLQDAHCELFDMFKNKIIESKA